MRWTETVLRTWGAQMNLVALSSHVTVSFLANSVPSRLCRTKWGKIGPKVTGMTVMRDTLRVPLTIEIPAGWSILLHQSKFRSRTESVTWWITSCVINLHVPNIRYFIRAGPQNNARLKPVRRAKKFADPCFKE